MEKQIKDTPGVIAPPPLIFLSGLLLGGIIDWLQPFYILPTAYLTILRALGVLLIGIGLGIIFIARNKMQRAETNIEPWKPTNAIISDGIYSYSRNPIYVAMILIYFGVTIIVNSMWILSFIFVVFFITHFGVILREEKYLEKKFGEEYLNYKNKVRRWI